MFDGLSLSDKIDIIVSASMVIPNPNDKYSGILLKYPLHKDKMIADFLYNSAIEKAREANIYTREEMKKVLEERGVITQEYYDKQSILEKRIESNKILLSKMRFAKDKIAKLEATIQKLEEELSDLNASRERFFVNTSDHLAMTEKLNYMVWATVFALDGSKLWQSYDDYMNERDIGYRSSIFYAVLPFLFGFDMKQLRYIARSSEWRVRYTAFLKGHFPLFSRSPEDYTKDQLGLLHWSNYYQSIYEMLPEDRPTEDIIEDDDALDKYMDEYFKSIEQERKISKARNKGSDAFDKEEVVVTRFNELYQDLEYDKVKPKGDGPVVHEGRRRR